MNGVTVSDDTEIIFIEEVNCASCGIRFGLPKTLHKRRQDDHRAFYCPNGHSNYYPPPEKERDEEMEEKDARIKELRVELADTRDELARERAHADQLSSGKRPLFRPLKRT